MVWTSEETNDLRGCGGDRSYLRHEFRRGLGHFAQWGHRARRRSEVLGRTRVALAGWILMVSTGLFAASVGFATSAQASGTNASANAANHVIPP